MPVFWMPPALPQMGDHAGMPQMQHRQALPAQVESPDHITILAPTAKATVQPGIGRMFEYSDGVQATYGPTVIHADHMILHEEGIERWGEAFGNVRLDDPEGTVTATRLVFRWNERTGSAENAHIMAGGMTLEAEHVDVQKDRWELTNVTATSCGERHPLYLIRTRRLTIRPGKQAVAEHPRLSILGHQLVTLPTQRISLDQRDPGLRAPSLSYKPGSGFGVSWFSGFLLDDQTSLTGTYTAFPKELPSFTAQLARTFIPADKSSTPIPPRSELAERFNFSYLDDVYVPKPTSEFNYMRTPRNSVALMTTWNVGASGRDVDFRYSKPLEAAYEVGGNFGSFQMVSQARLHWIKEDGHAMHTRGMLQTSVAAPNFHLGRDLFTRIRVDSSAFVGGTTFGWVRGQFGIQYEPSKIVTAGVAYIDSVSSGTPLFPIDELFSKRAFHGRLDLDLGPTKLSFLLKYDLDRRTAYDREYQIRQVVGCIEPFILYRKFPSSYVIGFRLRADDFFSAIERRRVTRTQPAGPTVISGPMKH